jgi:short-subunit dehydrogenase
MKKIKTILITGAGTGIGKDSALELALRGHSIIATTETNEQAREMQEASVETGLSIESFKLDITNKNDREKITNYNIDVLINNAAIGESGSLAEINIDKVRNNFEVNVFSSLELTQLALKKMLKKDKGTIVFISSLAGRTVMPFLGSYTMTKFSLSAGSEALRKELKRITKNVHITVVEPGAYHTGFNQIMLAKKYKWMNKNSYFYKIIYKLKIGEKMYFKIMEKKSTKSIVNKIIKASESKRPSLRYSAPWWQDLGVKIQRVFGK